MCYGPQEESYHNAQGKKKFHYCLCVIIYLYINAAGDDFSRAKRILKIHVLFNDRTDVAFIATHPVK